MSECSAAVSQQTAEVNCLNSKLAYDAVAQIQNQALIDNQSDSRAWAELRLSEARDAQVTKHLANVAALATDQTGQTENQQNTSPEDQATAESIKGAVGAAVSDTITALVPVIASAVATATAQSMAAVLPVLVAAVGGASTTAKS